MSSGNETNKAWTGVDQRVQLQMSKEDFRRVADVRREVWKGGLIGGVAGLSAGFLSYVGYKSMLAPPWLQRKHAFLFTMAGAALGGYVGSATRGMAAFDHIGDSELRHSTARSVYRGGDADCIVGDGIECSRNWMSYCTAF